MATPIASAQSRWRRSSLAETVTSDLASAACYRFPEDIGVVAVVVAELELGDVERQVFFADLVIGADNATFNQRPKALDCLGVHSANNIFATGVVNRLMRIFLAQMFVTDPLIAAQQANLVGDGFADEAFQGHGLNVLDNPSDDIATSLDSADDNRFARTTCPSGTAAFPATALVFVPVFGEAADESFINLDDANKLLELFVLQCSADAVAHIPSRLVGTETHIAVDLAGTDALLAGQHEVDDAEPLPQVHIRILEDRPSDVGKPIAARAAIRALPFPFHRLERIDAHTATARAMDAIRPAMGDKVGVTSILCGEGRFPLGDSHLMDLAGLFGSGHDGSPYRQVGVCHV
jgi:hypothetical protein